MGASEKFSAGMDDLKGKTKESVGKATDNDSMVAEGKLDQAKADAKRATEDVKDAAKDLFDK